MMELTWTQMNPLSLPLSRQPQVDDYMFNIITQSRSDSLIRPLFLKTCLTNPPTPDFRKSE